MARHDHHRRCEHALAFCEKCDVPYCTKCNFEWAMPCHQNHYDWTFDPLPKAQPLWSSTVGTSWSPNTYGGVTTTTNHAEHAEAR